MVFPRENFSAVIVCRMCGGGARLPVDEASCQTGTTIFQLRILNVLRLILSTSLNGLRCRGEEDDHGSSSALHPLSREKIVRAVFSLAGQLSAARGGMNLASSGLLGCFDKACQLEE
jgi:hypothetical protein